MLSGAGPKAHGASRRLEIHIEGMVQGVGFRPFVHALATGLGLAGQVSNDSRGVRVEVEGGSEATERFLERVRRDAPPLAVVESMDWREVPAIGGVARFDIVASASEGSRTALISADVATCDDCLREMREPSDRRFRYPFINCTRCGPRFTIVTDVPYDRRSTTMARFAMCGDCAREYLDPVDRRFHAQPVACPACGPRLRLVGREGDPLAQGAALLRNGRILAVKGLGGWHLAVDATEESAVARLRERKHREEKPLAVMARDLAAAEALAELDDAERRLLAGERRPIVLLRRRPSAAVAPSVAPASCLLGVMLPYTPLHHLLLEEVDRPVVLTSGNASDEPIAYRDEDAFDRLAGIADAFLTHDRPIHTRADDSVARVFAGLPVLLRRSRGYVPQPVRGPFTRPVLACGAALKSTLCVTRGHHAFLSQHLGDLDTLESLGAFEEAAEHMMRLFDVTPQVVAHDLHPDMASTRWAMAREGVRQVAVQHHFAHVASCLVDNGEEGPAIGVAFDGFGLGTDGTAWGGEVLVADLRGFQRAGHLSAVPMPGGDAAAREPWRMAAVHAARAVGMEAASALAVRERNGERWDAVLRMAERGVNAPLTSSVGRLFDAVASLLGLRDRVSFEGQAAAELEQAADPSETGAYEPLLLPRADGTFEMDAAALVRQVIEDRAATPRVSARFHNGLALAARDACRLVRERTGLGTVALTGGVFQNLLLLSRTVAALEADGFRVLRHRQVPCNDAGISLGQAAVASRA